MQLRGYDIIGINIDKYSHNNNTAISLDCNEGAFAIMGINCSREDANRWDKLYNTLKEKDSK